MFIPLLLVNLKYSFGQNYNVFDLVETQNLDQPYKTSLVDHENFCIAKCHCDESCFTYELKLQNQNQFQCNLYNNTYSKNGQNTSLV